MSDRFPDDLLDEIRSRISITEVVGQYVSWDRSKSNEARGDMWACCPFHGESTPSFHAENEKGLYSCFGCGVGGDHFKFVMEHTGKSFPEAVEVVAELAGVPLPESGERRPERTPEQPRKTKAQPQPSAELGKRELVKAYDYTDGDGNLLYQVRRIQIRMPDGSWAKAKDGKSTWKDFRQCRPSGLSDGSWLWGLGAGEYIRPAPGKDWSPWDRKKAERWPDAETRFFDTGVEHTVYRLPQVEIAISEGQTILLCYSPDTEVLTPAGWVRFPDLKPGVQVAQYNLETESVSFTTPKAHQRYRYRGEMVNIKAAWCDLLVTPDHRQPRRNIKSGRIPCPASIAPASEVRYGHQLPCSGVKRDGEPVLLTAARLMVAWLADGVWEPRGDQVSWNIKKDRKKERLRAAFAVLGIKWTEHEYPSTPGWTNFRVMKAAIAEHFPVGPDKRWHWDMLDWSADARGAALDELQYWDGDGQSDTSTRFFTGEWQSAEVVCAMAAITGYHANLRVDRREGKNDSYVVNLSHKTWRQIANTPARVDYDGEVFCCTVDTGLLVVRRNGKVTISGNCEGEKDAETAVSLGYCGTTNSSGSKHWTAAHAARFKDADVVICLDNDEAGDRADKLATSMKGIAKRIRVLDFAKIVPGFDHKGDITDWVEKFGGTSDQLEKIIAGLADYRPRPPQSKFGALMVKDAAALSKRHEWLVQDMIERKGTAAFSGYSGSGKSFLMIDLAFAIAMGRPFWGRDTKKGVVVYQVGEGAEGLMKRIDGFIQDRGIEDPASVPLVILPRKINLFVSDDDTNALIAEAKAWAAYYDLPLRMVVIDTYNKATRGAKEIDGENIGRVNDRLERIAEECDCCAAVVDHLSKGGTVRGHGSKTDDVTNMIRVEVDDKKVDNNGRPIRRMRLDKNKDGEKGQVINFVLRQVVVGFSEAGKPSTTCVCDPPDGNQEELERSGRLPLNQATILRVLRDTIDLEGTSPPGGLVVPAGKNVVAWKAFRTMLERKWQYSAPENEPEQRAKELHRVVTDACKKLQLAGYIDKDNPSGLIWWTGKTDRPIPKPRADPPPLPDDVRDALKDGVPF